MSSRIKARTETALWLLLLFGVAVSVIWVRTATVKATYLYAQQERELRKINQKIQRARVNWLKLTAPGRLDGLARNLKLYPAKPDQVLRYESR